MAGKLGDKIAKVSHIGQLPDNSAEVRRIVKRATILGREEYPYELRYRITQFDKLPNAGEPKAFSHANTSSETTRPIVEAKCHLRLCELRIP